MRGKGKEEEEEEEEYRVSHVYIEGNWVDYLMGAVDIGYIVLCFLHALAQIIMLESSCVLFVN